MPPEVVAVPREFPSCRRASTAGVARAIVAAAAGTDLANLIDPGEFPSVAGHDYPAAMGMVIQAIEAVSDADDDAASVVVNPAAWNQL